MTSQNYKNQKEKTPKKRFIYTSVLTLITVLVWFVLIWWIWCHINEKNNSLNTGIDKNGIATYQIPEDLRAKIDFAVAAAGALPVNNKSFEIDSCLHNQVLAYNTDRFVCMDMTTGQQVSVGSQGVQGTPGVNGSNGSQGIKGDPGIISVNVGNGISGSLASQILNLDIVIDPFGGLSNSSNGLSLIASCTNGQILRFISGSWTCGNDNDTDTQDLSVSSNILSLVDGGSVDLTPYLDNTDSQALSWDNGTRSLFLVNGGSVIIPDNDTTYTAGTGVTITPGTQINAILGTDIDSSEIVDGTITNTDLAFNSVNSSNIVDGTVTSTDIATGTVTSSNIADNTIATIDLDDGVVTTIKVADSAITTIKVADGAIITSKLADGSVASIKIAADAITTDKILDGTIATADLANASVTTAKIAPGGTDQVLVTDGSGSVAWINKDAFGAIADQVTIQGLGTTASPFLVKDLGIATAKLADGAVTNIKLAVDAITTDKILDGTIATADLANNSITTAKLVDSSVTTSKILDGAITNAKLANDSVASANIIDGTILSADIADGTIATADLATAAITSAKLANDSVTLAKIADCNAAGQIIKYNGMDWICSGDDDNQTLSWNNATSTLSLTNGGSVVISDTTLADNGLTLDGSTIEFGGALSRSTSIDQNSFNLEFNNTLSSGRTTEIHSGDDVIGAGVEGVGFTSQDAVGIMSYLFAGDSSSTGGSTNMAGVGVNDFTNNSFTQYNAFDTGFGLGSRVASINGALSSETIWLNDSILFNAANGLNNSNLTLDPNALYVNTDLNLTGELQTNGNPGSSGQVLVSNGLGSVPYWVDPGSLLTSGNGISIVGGEIAINSPACSGTDKLVWDGAGFICATDVDTDTTYTAGTGITITPGTQINATLGTDIDSVEIVDGTIVNADLAASSVNSSNIVDGTVTSTDITDGTVTGTDLANNTVTSSNITDGTITSTDLANTGVTAGTYGSGTVIPVITVNAQGQLTSVTTAAIPTASTSTTGLLTSTDWNTFNGKENVLTFTGNGLFTRSGNTVTGLACTAGQIAKWTGASFACGVDNDSGGITSLNGLSIATQTLATGSSGTDFNIVSSGSTHTFNIPDAGTTSRGLITTGTQTLAGNKTLQDNLTVNGSAITFGNAPTDLVTFNAAVSLSNASCSSASTNIFCNGGNSFGNTATIGTNDSFGVNFETNNTVVASLSPTGEFLIKDPSDSTISFQVQDSASLPIFSVDTVSNRIIVGGGSISDATGISLVLDSSTVEPTGVNGAMYYNSAANKFRCYQNGSWIDCIGSGVTSNASYTILAAPVTWTNAPAADTEFIGTYRIAADLTNFNQFRFIVARPLGTANAGADCRVQYSTSYGGAYANLDGATGPEVDYSTAGTIVGPWSTIVPAAKTDIYLRVMCKEGNNVLDPQFRGLSIEVR